MILGCLRGLRRKRTMRVMVVTRRRLNNTSEKECFKGLSPRKMPTLGTSMAASHTMLIGVPDTLIELFMYSWRTREGLTCWFHPLGVCSKRCAGNTLVMHEILWKLTTSLHAKSHRKEKRFSERERESSYKGLWINVKVGELVFLLHSNG